MTIFNAAASDLDLRALLGQIDDTDPIADDFLTLPADHDLDDPEVVALFAVDAPIEVAEDLPF